MRKDNAYQQQLEGFAQMTPAQRLSAAQALYWSTRRLKYAYLKAQNPDWTPQQLERTVKAAFRHVRD